MEAVIAPGFEAEAHEGAGQEDQPARDGHGHDRIHKVSGFDLRRVMGGLLAQEWDLHRLERETLRGGDQAQADRRGVEGPALAWTVVEARQVERHRLRQRACRRSASARAR